MSASLGQGLVIARSKPCHGKETDHAPGCTTVDFGKGQSLRESNVLPFHDILDADMAKSALAAEGVTYAG
jgi:hypothetical protein